MTSGGGGADMATTASTIAAMRQGAPGNYQLDNVVAMAVTPSTTSPRLFVQDAAGGAFSAMQVECSSTSGAHPCSHTVDVHNVMPGDSVTVTGLFLKTSQPKGATENFYISTITNNGHSATQPPAGPTLTEKDIAIGNGHTQAPNWFMKVTLKPSEELSMYDWSTPEQVFVGATGCPYQLGFSMIPTSALATPSTVCTVKTAQPTSVAKKDNAVLIATDFYLTFQISSDCRCAGTHAGVKAPSADTKWPMNGTMTGFLIYDDVFMSNPVETYLKFAPDEAGGALTMLVDPPM